jgi:hypothetical protein
MWTYTKCFWKSIFKVSQYEYEERQRKVECLVGWEVDEAGSELCSMVAFDYSWISIQHSKENVWHWLSELYWKRSVNFVLLVTVWEFSVCALPLSLCVLSCGPTQPPFQYPLNNEFLKIVIASLATVDDRNSVSRRNSSASTVFWGMTPCSLVETMQTKLLPPYSEWSQTLTFIWRSPLWLILIP